MVIMRAVLKKLLTAVRWVLTAGALTLIVGDLCTEIHGLPRAVVGRVERRLADLGVAVRIERLKVGVVRGVVAEGIVVFHGDAPEARLLEAERVHLAILPLGSLTRLRPTQVAVEGCSLYLSDVAEPTGRQRQLAIARDVCGKARICGRDVETFRLAGTLMGVRTQLTGSLMAARGQSSQDPHDPGARLSRWVRESTPFVERLRAFVGEYGIGDGSMELHVDACVGKPRMTTASGRFAFSGLVVKGVAVEKVKGAIRYAGDEFRLQDLALSVSRDDLVQGEVTVWPSRELIAARLTGRLTAPVVCSMLGWSRSQSITAMDVTQPLSFTVELQPSAYAPRRWVGSASCQMDHCRVRDLYVTQCKGHISFGDQQVILRDIECRLGTEEGVESLSGALRWWPEDNVVAGDLAVQCYPARLAKRLRVALPSGLAGVRFVGQPARLQFSLDKSPRAWTQWTGKGTFDMEDIRCERWRLRRLAGDVELTPKRLELKNIVASWPESELGDVRGGLVIELPAEPDVSRIVTRFGFGVHDSRDEAAPDGVRAPGEPPAPPLQGLIALDTEKRTVEAELKSNVDPGRLYELLRVPLRLPTNAIIARVGFDGTPPQAVLRLPATPWSFRNWRVDGQVTGKDGKYGSLFFREFDSQVSLNSAGIKFSDIRAELGDGTVMERLQLSLSFNPVRLQLKGRIHGRPDFVSGFIEHERAREHYDAVWQHVEWSPTSQPVFDLNDFTLQHGPQPGDWRLLIQAHLEVDNATYRGAKTDRVTLDLKLNLPEKILIENIKVRARDAELLGRAELELQGLASCKINLAGTCDPRRILHTIDPRWERYIESCEFDPATTVECEGSFFLGSEPRLRLKGRLRTPHCRYTHMLRGKDSAKPQATASSVGGDESAAPSVAGKSRARQIPFEIDNLSAEWGLDSAKASWRSVTGAWSGGTISTTGYFDESSDSGLVAVRLAGVDVSRMCREIGVRREKPWPGRLDGSCRIQVLKGWAGQDLQLGGNGAIRISEGNFWDVPVFARLGKLLDMPLLSTLSRGKVSGLGTISELHADLDFRGQRLVLPQLWTNGTFISLNGHGEYEWRTQQVYFRMKGGALRGIRLLSSLLKPLSWVFEAELTGTVDAYEWRLVTGLDRVLGGKDDSPGQRDGLK